MLHSRISKYTFIIALPLLSAFIAHYPLSGISDSYAYKKNMAWHENTVCASAEFVYQQGISTIKLVVLLSY